MSEFTDELDTMMGLEEQALQESPQQIIARLAALSSVEYESARTDAAKKLNFRASILDAEVKKARKYTSGGDDVISYLVSNFIFVADGGGCFYNIEHGITQTSVSVDMLHGNMGLDILPTEVINSSKHKKTADFLGWIPSNEEIFNYDGRTYANTYTPPSISPVAGDVGNWLKLCNFIYKEHCKLVLQHMAFTVQRPEEKIRWQVLTHGMARTGKSMAVRPIARIFGSSASVIDNDRAEETWGDVFFQKKVILFEEVYQSDMKQFNRLKPRLSNSDIETLNLKGGQMITQRNLYSMYLFSNHDDALRFDITENKLLVINSPSAYIFDDEGSSQRFYTELGKKLDNDEYIGFIYHYLLNLDISDFNYSQLPVVTEAAKAMSSASRPEPELALQEWLEDKVKPFDRKAVLLSGIKTQLDIAGYSRYSQKNITNFLKAHGFKSYLGQKTIEGKRIAHRFWANNQDCDYNPPAWLYDFYVQNSREFFN